MRGFSKPLKNWSRRSGLNGRPAVYETAALPTELRRLGVVDLNGHGRSKSSGHDTDRALDLSMNPICSEEEWYLSAVLNSKLFESRNGLQSDQGPLAWPGEAEGLLFVAILFLCYLAHLLLGVDTEFAGEDRAVLVEIG